MSKKYIIMVLCFQFGYVWATIILDSFKNTTFSAAWRRHETQQGGHRDGLQKAILANRRDDLR